MISECVPIATYIKKCTSKNNKKITLQNQFGDAHVEQIPIHAHIQIQSIVINNSEMVWTTI